MLTCVICGRLYESDNGYSFECDECGLIGMCKACAEIGAHKCEPLPFWIAEDEPEDDWVPCGD